MKTVTIHRARYGPRDDSHQLLASSLPSGVLPPELQLITDAPQSPPRGYRWDAHVSCAPVGRWFAFWMFWSDETQSRAGHVCVEVALILRARVGEIGDVTSIFNALARARAAPPEKVEALQFPATLSEPPVEPRRYRALTSLLADATRTKLPVIADHGELRALMQELWRNLWPAARAGLIVRWFCQPHHLGRRPPELIVATPRARVDLWRGY